MSKIQKKDKTAKLEEFERIKKYLEQYDTVVVVKNTELQNFYLQTLRSSIDGKVVFAKKSLLQRYFPSLFYDQNFFLIFTNISEIEKIKSFNYMGFLEEGDKAPENIIISAGLIKNQKLHKYLKNIEHKGANTYLLEDFIISKEGEVIGENASNILKVKGERLAEKPIVIIDIIEAKSIKTIQ